MKKYIPFASKRWRVSFASESLLHRLAVFFFYMTAWDFVNTAGNITAGCQWPRRQRQRHEAKRGTRESPARGMSGERPNRARSDGDSSADKADDEANDVNQQRNQRKTRDKVTASRYRKSNRQRVPPTPPQCRQGPKARGTSIRPFVHPVRHLHHVPRLNRVEADVHGSAHFRVALASNPTS